MKGHSEVRQLNCLFFSFIWRYILVLIGLNWSDDKAQANDPSDVRIIMEPLVAYLPDQPRSQGVLLLGTLGMRLHAKCVLSAV